MPPPELKTSAFFADLPLFKGLAAAEIDRIARHHGTPRSARRDPVHLDGPCNGFHLVIYGQVSSRS